jgi:hypothetical protein
MADFLLDSDVVIWHLRGHSLIAERVLSLARHGRIGLSAVARAEVLQGMREPERRATLGFLDACETLSVEKETADRAGEIVRTFRSRGITIALPDALIGATALLAGLPLFTCNARHYPFEGLDLRALSA